MKWEEDNRALREENRALKGRLGTNSKNSSKPPSQDPFRERCSSRSEGGTRGGQPGHKGDKTELYPADQVSETVELLPELCPHCGSKSFGDAIGTEIGQTTDLPECKPYVKEFRMQTCPCT